MKFSLAQEHNRQDVVAHEFYNHMQSFDLLRQEETAIITHAYLRMGSSAFLMMALDAALADFDYLVSLGKVIPPKQVQMREYFLALRTLLTRAADIDVTNEKPKAVEYIREDYSEVEG